MPRCINSFNDFSYPVFTFTTMITESDVDEDMTTLMTTRMATKTSTDEVLSRTETGQWYYRLSSQVREVNNRLSRW